MKQTFNQSVIDKLEEYGITEAAETDEALLYLLSVFFELTCESVSPEIIRRVNLTKIVTRDFDDPARPTVVWTMPLFSTSADVAELNWEWIAEYRELFGAIRPTAKGELKNVVKKMKTFFSQNPHVRKEDVMEAARRYIHEHISSRSDSKFLQQADYFIRKQGPNGGEGSRLQLWLEIIFDERKRLEDQGPGNRFMQEMR